jgi:hypothetical protein
MKKLLMFVVVFGLAASLGAQSLADLAKREKARRESLKDRRAVVVTNVDLMRVQKTAAIQVTDPEAVAEEAGDEASPAADPESLSGEAEAGNPPSGSGAPSGRRIVPRTAPDGPLITGEVNRDREGGGGTLDAQLKSARDLVDLLTTKMNGLRQQFESQDAMVPGSVIQQQLDETNQRLVKAQAQQARIESLLAKQDPSKKAPGETER